MIPLYIILIIFFVTVAGLAGGVIYLALKDDETGNKNEVVEDTDDDNKTDTGGQQGEIVPEDEMVDMEILSDPVSEPTFYSFQRLIPARKNANGTITVFQINEETLELSNIDLEPDKGVNLKRTLLNLHHFIVLGDNLDDFSDPHNPQNRLWIKARVPRETNIIVLAYPESTEETIYPLNERQSNMFVIDDDEGLYVPFTCKLIDHESGEERFFTTDFKPLSKIGYIVFFDHERVEQYEDGTSVFYPPDIVNYQQAIIDNNCHSTFFIENNCAYSTCTVATDACVCADGTTCNADIDNGNCPCEEPLV